MKVIIFHEVVKKDPVIIDGRHLRIGFEVEKAIDLPFVPFVGMSIWLPCELGDGKEYDDHQFEITGVTWRHAEQHFFCDSSSQSDMPTCQEGQRVADFYERAGFTVERANLCEGRW